MREFFVSTNMKSSVNKNKMDILMVGWENQLQATTTTTTKISIVTRSARSAIEIAAHMYVCWRSRMVKREREEEFDVSEVAHTSSSADVKGVVKTLSPMKKSKSCSYFDDEIP